MRFQLLANKKPEFVDVDCIEEANYNYGDIKERLRNGVEESKQITEEVKRNFTRKIENVSGRF